MRTWVVLLALACAPAAWAQKVVILEIDGDSGNKLRDQIEAAVRKAAVVDVISLSHFKEVAAKKRLKGGAAMTAVGVSRVGKVIKLDAAVGGEVTTSSYKVVIYDRTGQELWTKELAVKKGLLSDEFVVKLSKAIATAAEQAAAKVQDPPVGGDDTDASLGQEIDLTGNTPDTTRNPVPNRNPSEPDEGSRDTDLEGEARRKRSKVGPPLIRGTVQGVTTWRSQCLRPGVNSCKDFDGLQETQQPQGIKIDYTSTVPYVGIAGSLDVFPLANLDNRVLQGFGVLGQFSYGVSTTRIVEQTAQGAGPEKKVVSTDVAWSAQLAWRFHFAMGYGDPPSTGYAGLRGGLQSRSFTIDPNAGVSLPSSQRVSPAGFPVIGLDAALPISKYVRVELGGSLFVSPAPSPEQIVGYGNLNDPTGGVTSSGFGLEGGVAGEIWGPLGYSLKVRYLAFTDHYFGQGQKWTVCNDQQCGGVAEESYLSLYWGVTVSY